MCTDHARRAGIIKDDDHGSYMKFLQWDTKVLRFFCVWDDRQSLYGDQRKFVLRYYLADDTMDMVEEHVANSGRRTGNFLTRGRISKKTPEIIVGSGDVHPGDYFTPADLMVGSTITICKLSSVVCTETALLQRSLLHAWLCDRQSHLLHLRL